jgi:hypothetical protein
MSLLFITPSFEPGQSGVGDYASRLAGMVSFDGYPCEMLAVSGQRVVFDARPEWVSLQFVSYGYHPKGLPFHLARRVRAAVGTARMEIMFHELWLGGPGASWRHRIYGVLQRWLIRDLVRQLRPAVIHTHATPYMDALRRQGWAPVQLPLLATIPVNERCDENTFAPWLERTSGFHDACGRVIFCLFGTLYPEWEPQTLVPLIRAHLERTGTRGLVLAFGHLGARGKEKWGRLQMESDERLRFVALGPLAAGDVSRCFRASDYGISTTPPDLIEKSSAAAAMFEHGLPVLASRPPMFGDAMLHRVEARQPLLIAGEKLAGFAQVPKQAPDQARSRRIAGQFCSDLALPVRRRSALAEANHA